MACTYWIFSWCLILSFFIYITEEAHISQGKYDNEDHYHPVRKPTGGHAQPGQKTGDENTHDWWQDGQGELTRALELDEIIGEAKNVIMFIGDGMGISTVTAARFFKSTQDGSLVRSTKLSWENLPYAALSKTYNTNQQTADSAGTATAFLSGWKTRAGVIGVNGNVPRYDCNAVAGNELNNILKFSQQEGKRTGVVTTTRITHATPASAYAHSSDRNYEAYVPGGCVHDDIAKQLIMDTANTNINVLMGGGRRNFMPNTATDPETGSSGYRRDGQDLMQEWLNMKQGQGLQSSQYKLVMNQTDFDAISTSDVDYLLGLFESSHMQYEADRASDTWGEPSLREMTQKAIQVLDKGGPLSPGYFLLVEGGRIDHAHHDTNSHRSMMDTLALSDAVQQAMDMTDMDETLIIVTSDHSHVFSMGGYASLNRDVLQVTDAGWGSDSKPYLILGYANGPGYLDHRTADGNLNTAQLRKNITEDTTVKDFRQDAGVPLSSETHGGEEVAIYSRGPMAHLLHGVHEQSYIAHVMMYASCVGPNQNLCDLPRNKITKSLRKPEDDPSKTVGSENNSQSLVAQPYVLVCTILLSLYAFHRK